MSRYLKNHLYDYIFCILLAMGLSLNVLSSFVISKELYGNYLLVGCICAAVLAVLFLISANKTILICTGTAGILIFAYIVINMLRNGTLRKSEVAEKSLGLFLVVTVLTCVFCFLLTRTRLLSILFSVSMLIVCGMFSFFEFPVNTIGLIVAALGMILEITFQNYLNRINKADYGNMSLRNFTGMVAVIAMVAVVVSCGVYYLVIKPIAPPTAELKLITDYMSWDVIEKKGVSSNMQIESKDDLSDNLNDNLHKTNQKDDSNSDDSKTKSDSEDAESKNDDMTKKSKNSRTAFSVSYDELLKATFILLFCILLCCLPFVLKLLQRKIRRKKLQTMEPPNGVRYLFSYFMDKFSYLHIARPESYTLSEYVRYNKRELQYFKSKNGTEFSELANIYSNLIYGGIVPNSAEYGRYLDFYDGYIPVLKDRMGKFHYYLKFWFI